MPNSLSSRDFSHTTNAVFLYTRNDGSFWAIQYLIPLKETDCSNQQSQWSYSMKYIHIWEKISMTKRALHINFVIGQCESSVFWTWFLPIVIQSYKYLNTRFLSTFFIHSTVYKFAPSVSRQFWLLKSKRMIGMSTLLVEGWCNWLHMLKLWASNAWPQTNSLCKHSSGFKNMPQQSLI